jgi:hypothetical protein
MFILFNRIGSSLRCQDYSPRYILLCVMSMYRKYKYSSFKMLGLDENYFV